MAIFSTALNRARIPIENERFRNFIVLTLLLGFAGWLQLSGFVEWRTVWKESRPHLAIEKTCQVFRPEVLDVRFSESQHPQSLDVLHAQITALELMERCEDLRYSALPQLTSDHLPDRDFDLMFPILTTAE